MKDQKPSVITRQATGVAAKGGEAISIESAFSALCTQLDAAEDRAEKFKGQVLDTCKRAEAAEARIAAMLEALQPFAILAERISDFWDGERRISTLTINPIRVRHLRRARALYAALSRQPPRAPDEPGDRALEETKS